MYSKVDSIKELNTISDDSYDEDESLDIVENESNIYDSIAVDEKITTSNLRTSSKITANIILNSMHSLNKKEELVTSQSDLSAEYNINFENFLTKEYSLIESYLQKEYLENNANSNISNQNNCLKIYDQINLLKKELKDLKIQIDEFKINYKEELNNLEILNNKRKEISKKCFNIENSDCRVPEELYNKRKELNKNISELKQQLLNQDFKDEELENKIDSLLKEYRSIDDKIYSLEKSCNLKQNTINNSNNVCREKEQLLKDAELVRKLLESTKDAEEIKKLEYKLKYIDEKLANVVCLDFDIQGNQISIKKENIDLKNSTQDSFLINQNKLDDCVAELVANNIDKDAAYQACKYKFTEQEKIYSQKIRTLEDRLKIQQETINKLQVSISDVKQKIKSKNTDEEKLELVSNNFENIQEHTLAVLDKIISVREKKLAEIENSNLIEDDKDKFIYLLNDELAKLNIIKEEIEFVTTSNELRNLLKKARSLDLNSKKLSLIIELQKNTFKINNIINTYQLVNNSDVLDLYNILNSKVNSLEYSNLDSVTLEQIKQTTDSYFKLKNLILEISNNKNKNEVVK